MGAVTGRPLFLAILLLVSLLTTSAQAGSILGEEWEKFLTERVSFSGFVENTTRTPVKLPDGRRIWSVGTALVVHVQNGRSTVLTTTRVYNQGLPASLFTLATLQRISRG